ncbi:MAG: STAS domain-containing protein [Candidatus Sericytochromatia bacterium]|nr:STAS domain-containing protein [Candidatus Sericytochromatia bacterium]
MSLQLEARQEGEVRVLVLEGELDAQTVGPFDKEMEGCLARGEVRIVLDCRGLAFIASAGLGVLMGVLGPVQQAGGTIVLAGVQAEVRRTFDLLDFSSLFPFADSLGEALRLAAPAGGQG